MSYPKMADLISTLLEKTQSGKLNWEATAMSDTFQASFPKYAVLIFSTTHNDELDYVLQIINDYGEIVERVEDTDLLEVMSNPFITMRELHEAARRNAMGVEEALNDILDFLKPSR